MGEVMSVMGEALQIWWVS